MGEQQGYREMICCGAGTGIEDLQKLAFAEKILSSHLQVLPPPDGCKRPTEHSGNTAYPAQIGSCALRHRIFLPGPTLVVHQQVLADSLCGILRRQGIQADSASFFMMKPDVKKRPRRSAAGRDRPPHTPGGKTLHQCNCRPLYGTGHRGTARKRIPSASFCSLRRTASPVNYGEKITTAGEDTKRNRGS